jgi:hypothetical protein
MFRAVQERQRPIADWMTAVMDRRGISARAWADKAKLGKDTVSRAVREDYQHVTSTSTLVKLAEAIGERPPGVGGLLPSEALLAGIVEELSQALIGDRPPTAEIFATLAAALRDTLLHLADDPEAAGDPLQSRAIARSAARAHRRSVS